MTCMSTRHAPTGRCPRRSAPMREHYEAQVARAEKFGRTESECVCEICRAMAGIDAALFPKPIIVDEVYQIARSPE